MYIYLLYDFDLSYKYAWASILIWHFIVNKQNHKSQTEVQ